jgi:hypothetical protein
MVFAGCEQVFNQKNPALIAPGFFEDVVRIARANWVGRGSLRYPSEANWTFRSALSVTQTDGKWIEKQLEKAIATSCRDDGWGNAVPTASGLVSASGGKHMNIDLVERLTDGFRFVELKWKADDPVRAATQMMRYAALYMLYRLEPEIMAALPSKEMLRVPHVRFEVLAPREFYVSRFELLAFESFINRELREFCSSHLPNLTADFSYRSFPPEFNFIPGMDYEVVRKAVLDRGSPFQHIVKGNEILLDRRLPSQQLHIRGCHGTTVTSLADWQAFGLPQERSHHWKPGRSACELATSWTRGEMIRIPGEVDGLLSSNVETRDHLWTAGYIEHETALPFSTRGPRCHDLFLTGTSITGIPAVLSIEAKADESFDAPLWKKLAALEGKRSNLPLRIEWLTQYLFGESAFTDSEHQLLKELYEDMPYQLLAATAAVCLEAERHLTKQAIFVVHEFRTSLTEDGKLEINNVAFEKFFNHLATQNGLVTGETHAGILAGPLKMRSGSFNAIRFPSQIQLFVGKIRTDLRALESASAVC